MAPQDYWAAQGGLVVFEDYALRLRRGDSAVTHVPAGQTRLVEGVFPPLEAECRACHLDYPADQVLERLAGLALLDGASPAKRR